MILTLINPISPLVITQGISVDVFTVKMNRLKPIAIIKIDITQSGKSHPTIGQLKDMLHMVVV